MDHLREGVIRDEKTGELYLPATQRPDGTWRKPIKVKEGYIPQDEIPIYENKGVKWLNSKPTLPIGLAPQIKESIKHDFSDSNMSKSKKKNLKRKEKKNELNHTGAEYILSDHCVESTKDNCLTTLVSKLEIDENEAGSNNNINLKKIRTIRKRLKEIAELERNRLKGLELNEEQLVKLARKPDLEAELEKLIEIA